MKELKDIIEKAKKTGRGISRKFQETPNYKLSEGFNCPHCNKEQPIGKAENPIELNYEIPENLRIMNNETCYSWTEDEKCSHCGKMFSFINGC